MEIRCAEPKDIALVAQVLAAAADNLVRKGVPLWGPSMVSEAAVQGDVKAGMYFMATDSEGPVAVFRFQLDDPDFWPEIPAGSSAFIHRLAVHPRVQGRDFAQALLRHACELARQHGRRYLRLDCMSGRPKLSSVYERFGFKFHSQKLLGTQLFDRFELDLHA
jgi:GNAT superfamily N-acetyltransferase